MKTALISTIIAMLFSMPTFADDNPCEFPNPETGFTTETYEISNFNFSDSDIDCDPGPNCSVKITIKYRINDRGLYDDCDLKVIRYSISGNCDACVEELISFLAIFSFWKDPAISFRFDGYGSSFAFKESKCWYFDGTGGEQGYPGWHECDNGACCGVNYIVEEFVGTGNDRLEITTPDPSFEVYVPCELPCELRDNCEGLIDPLGLDGKMEIPADWASSSSGGFGKINLENFIETNSFVIIPNPVKDVALIKTGIELNKDSKISIVDVLGNVIMATEVKSQTNKIELNFSSLLSGVYFIIIDSGKNRYKQTIVK
jgi:hypothetical protein